jgi:hypothetical protein
MAAGKTFPTTDGCGHLLVLQAIGHLIATATGFLFRHGAGRGWKTSLGASLHSTMADGLSLEAVGAGCQGRLQSGQFTHQPWSRLLEVAGLALVQA